MKHSKLMIRAGAAAAGLAGGVILAGSALATTPPANGEVQTSEFYYAKPTPHEIVDVSAFHWGKQKTLAYTITNRTTGASAGSGSVALTGGAGSVDVTGLAVGKYKLTYTHIDGTSGVIDFAVTDNHNG
jgi:hypothetical protein